MYKRQGNLDAHQLLGLIYANRAERPDRGASSVPDAERGITHLEKGRDPLAPDPRLELTLARLYPATKNAPQAIKVLTDLLEDEGSFTDGELLLADAYEQAGERDQAITFLEAATTRDRPSARTLARLAELYEGAQRWKDAAAAYGQAAERSPRSSRELKRRQATALLETGETTAARDVLREVVAGDPPDGTALYLLSEIELQLKNFDAAEDAARRLMRAEPDGLRGAYALALVQAERREHRNVIETLEPAIANARRRSNVPPAQLASLLARVAAAYQDLGDYNRAIAAYRDALQATPSDLGLQARLTQTYIDAGRLSEALEVVRGAQRVHPGNLTLTRLEADALGKRGEVDDAIKVLRAALDANPDEPLSYVVLSDFYAARQRVDDAVDVLESARQKFPDDLTILFHLGSVLERGRRFDDAERRFREVIDRDPKHANALNYLGYMLAERGERLEESVRLLLRAIEIDPHNGSYLDSLGWAYYKLNRLDLAEPPLRQASDQLLTNSVVQDHMGDLLFKLGRVDEAIAAWERALAGDRDSIDPKTIEQKIRDARRGRP